jgi:hypothetical protein
MTSVSFFSALAREHAMRWSAPLLAAGLMCLVHAQDRPPGQQPPVFRAGVDVVQVEASILDKDRRPVRGLTKADFQVFEDRKPQEIVDVQEILFDVEPTPPVWASAVRPDVETNDLADRRLIAIVMDDLGCCKLPTARNPGPTKSTSPKAPNDVLISDRWAINNAIATAHRLIDGLGPRDLATVALTHDLMAIQPFTNDREALRDVVRRFAPITETGCRPKPPYPRPEFDLTWLLRMSPQPVKSVVVLKSPILIRLLEVPVCPDRMYTLPDTGGLKFPVLTPDAWRPPDPLDLPPVPVYTLNVSGLQVDRPALFHLNGPNPTGGRNFYLTNDLGPAVDEVLAENDSYYLIGFRTSRPTVDGKLRLLDIKVTRPGEHTVRARARYRRPAPPPKRGSSADRHPELLRPPPTTGNLLPSSDIMMTAAVAAFASPGTRNAVLLTTVDLTHRVAETPASASEELSVRTVAYSPSGDVKYDARVKTPLAVPAGAGWVSASVPSSLTVAPDHYDLWLSAHEPRTMRIGGVHYKVDVPDFSAHIVTLSGVVLGREPAQGAPLPPALAGLVPIVPTSARTFGQGDEIRAFLQVYQGRSTLLAPVELTVRVLDADGGTRDQIGETLGADRFTAHRAADYLLRLPLDRLTSGRYLLTIEARLGDRASPKRDVPFTVR